MVMADIPILRRRGAGVPSLTDLSTWQLGYDMTNDDLYMNNGSSIIYIGGLSLASTYVPYTGASANVDLGTYTLTAEQLTSTDDITMQGHLLSLGNGSANDVSIVFSGATASLTATWDESIGQLIFNNQVKISDTTVDTYGRLLIAQKFNYDLSA